MLLHANFIARRLAEHRQRERIWVWGSVGLVSAGLLIGAFCLEQKLEIRRLGWELIQAQRERDRYQVKVQQIERLKAAQAALQPRLRVLRQVHGQNQAWETLLRDVRGRLPAGLWLTKLAVTSPAKGTPAGASGRILSLEGMGFTYEEIGLFMQRLVRSGYFQEVRIGDCKEMLIRDHRVTSFQLDAPLTRHQSELVRSHLSRGRSEGPGEI